MDDLFARRWGAQSSVSLARAAPTIVNYALAARPRARSRAPLYTYTYIFEKSDDLESAVRASWHLPETSARRCSMKCVVKSVAPAAAAAAASSSSGEPLDSIGFVRVILYARLAERHVHNNRHSKTRKISLSRSLVQNGCRVGSRYYPLAAPSAIPSLRFDIHCDAAARYISICSIRLTVYFARGQTRFTYCYSSRVTKILPSFLFYWISNEPSLLSWLFSYYFFSACFRFYSTILSLLKWYIISIRNFV